MLPVSDFHLLEETIEQYKYGTRTSAAALLAWFLENVWRVEPEDVDDSICDGSGDKGIDGVLINDDLAEIAIFQSKHRSNEAASQGDRNLRDFIGVAVYFRNPEGIDNLLASEPNKELKNLLTRLQVRKKLEEANYSVRLIFVTNAEPDAAGRNYLNATANEEPPLDFWGRNQLAEVARRTQRAGLLEEIVELEATSDVLQQNLGNETHIAVALIEARRLVELNGIDNLTIFSPNVRLGLGNTRINKELTSTVKAIGQHLLFPAYHNGLTFLTNNLEVRGRVLHLTDIAVVNGCQSILALYHNRDALTPGLKLLVKVVKLGENPTELSEQITYRANNQNSVNIRDQRSTHPIQRDLQIQVRESYGDRLFYAVRQGEPSDTREVLDNRVAAQLITAVWLKEPWNAVRKLRLFDEDYHRVFTRNIDAHKLYFAHRLNELVAQKRNDLNPELRSSFASVRFTLVYLVAQMMRQGGRGEELFTNPQRWLEGNETDIVEALETFIEEARINKLLC